MRQLRNTSNSVPRSLLARLADQDLNSLNRPFLIAALAAMGEPAVDHLRPHINWTLPGSPKPWDWPVDPYNEDELGRLIDTTSGAAEALSLMGVDPTSDLMATLATDDLSARDAAAVALGRLKDPAAVVPLFETLARPISKESVHAAREALRGIGDAAVESLIGCLSSEVADIRAVAAQELAEIGAGYPPEPLLALLNERKVKVRIAAMQALAKLPAAEVTEVLAQALRRQLRRRGKEVQQRNGVQSPVRSGASARLV